MADASRIRSFLDDRPDLEPAVETVLEAEEPWTFDDVDVDSGAFGELVSHGVVEKSDGGYRVADPAAVRLALDRPETDDRAGENATGDVWARLPQTPTPTSIVAVVGGLLLLAGLRLSSLMGVFRGDDTVLSANDPYYYRYVIEQSLASGGPTLTSLPSKAATGEPLFVATLQTVADVVAGGPEGVGVVLAWYPVVAAVATGVLVYTLATTLTRDRRVALAVLMMFALTPGHALRTSLGFADHHAFDYVWLTLTVLAVTGLAAEMTRRDTPRVGRTTVGVFGVAAGVAGQTLAWDASSLLLLPLGAYLALDGLLAVYTGRSPSRTHVPTLVGLGGGAAVVWAIHSALGWHTTLVAVLPTLLFVGGVTVVGSAEVSHRFDLHVAVPVVAGAVAGVTALTVVSGRYPVQWGRLVTDAETRLLRTDTIAETSGLFGSSFGWLLLFGFVLLLAVPPLLVTTRRASDRPVWVPLVVYTWYFVALAVAQVRFVGQMAPFTAVFAGVGFVALAGWVDIIDEPPTLIRDVPEAFHSLEIPDRATLQSLLVLFLLVGSLSFVQIPVKTGQLTHTGAQYETASWMADRAEEREMEYPDSYVFSQWGDNRFYNYFVNGQSESYGFARSNYAQFLFGTDAEQWYDRLAERTGFIVVSSEAVGNATTMGTRLYRADGSRTESVPGLTHYRLVFVSENEQYKVFTPVPGARIVGQAGSNQTLTVGTDVTVGSYETTYERRIETGTDGNYSVTVPYSGEYRVGDSSVVVRPSAVQNGSRVTVGR